ncbi:hypothetical protein AGMMS50293_30530 [Spirochaetia bacterium]|nr:hypothetical protein AGMMS50293_30530 [Spirochaetia bacterium]
MGGLTLNIANFGSILDFVGSAIGRNNGGGQSGLGKVIEAAENTAARLASGVDKLVLGGVRYDEKGNIILGDTIQNKEGTGRIITLADIGNVNDQAIRLQHEAYRNGLVDNKNYIETQQAVLAHTKMAQDMFNGGQGISIMNLRDIDAYIKAGGDMSKFYAYVDENYGSSADFWMLMEDGSLKYDGDGWLKDPNGNYIHKNGERIGAETPEAGLAKILGITPEAAYELMKNSGFVEKDGYWHRDAATNEINMTKSITLDNPIYADNYYNRLENYNTLNIYNTLVKEGYMAKDNELYIMGGYDNDQLPYISYEEYKARNFILGVQYYPTRDTYVGNDVTTLLGSAGNIATNPHRGTDTAVPKGTVSQLLFFNDTSKVEYASQGSVDINTTQGLNVILSTQISYNYKGEDLSETIYYRIMHLSEVAVIENATPNWDTVLGKTGNTGKMGDLTYGNHAHEEIFTNKLPSPYLDYLTRMTPNVTQRVFNNNTYYYDKFLFADKSKYTIRPDAGTYNNK